MSITNHKAFGQFGFIQKLKKGNASLIFASFIQKKINQDLTAKEFKQKYFEKSIPIELILKQELSKPVTIKITTTKMPMNVLSNRESKERDIQKIKICLNQIEGIARYLKFNCINDRTFMKAISYMKYEYYEANTYIFRQGEMSDKFYGIISGQVSIRAKKTFKKNKIVSNSVEQEKTVFGPGMCLGEWGIIYSIPRTASAFTYTLTEVFSLDKDAFDKTLSKEIVRSDQEKKLFVANRFPHLAKVNKYQNILTQIIPLFFDNNNVVYSEFDKAEYLYVLYQGECIMTKFLYPDKIEDISSQREKMLTLFKIDKGGILGLDTINPNSKHGTNIIVTRDFTVLYRIKLDFLKECDILVLRFLKSMYKTQQELIHNSLQREIHQIEKRQRNAMAQRKNISAEIVLIRKITDLINAMTKENKRPSSKGTLNLNIKQNAKITFTPLFKQTKYAIYSKSSTKKNKTNNVSIPVLFFSSTINRSRNKSQVSLMKIKTERDRKREERNDNNMMKLINTFYSHNSNSNRNRNRNGSMAKLITYNSGNFDLPLVA